MSDIRTSTVLGHHFSSNCFSSIVASRAQGGDTAPSERSAHADGDSLPGASTHLYAIRTDTGEFVEAYPLLREERVLARGLQHPGALGHVGELILLPERRAPAHLVRMPPAWDPRTVEGRVAAVAASSTNGERGPGRVLCFDTSSREMWEVATGLHSPSAAVHDPGTGHVIVISLSVAVAATADAPTAAARVSFHALGSPHESSLRRTSPALCGVSVTPLPSRGNPERTQVTGAALLSGCLYVTLAHSSDPDSLSGQGALLIYRISKAGERKDGVAVRHVDTVPLSSGRPSGVSIACPDAHPRFDGTPHLLVSFSSSSGSLRSKTEAEGENEPEKSEGLLAAALDPRDGGALDGLLRWRPLVDWAPVSAACVDSEGSMFCSLASPFPCSVVVWAWQDTRSEVDSLLDRPDPFHEGAWRPSTVHGLENAPAGFGTTAPADPALESVRRGLATATPRQSSSARPHESSQSSLEGLRQSGHVHPSLAQRQSDVSENETMDAHNQAQAARAVAIRAAQVLPPRMAPHHSGGRRGISAQTNAAGRGQARAQASATKAAQGGDAPPLNEWYTGVSRTLDEHMRDPLFEERVVIGPDGVSIVPDEGVVDEPLQQALERQDPPKLASPASEGALGKLQDSEHEASVRVIVRCRPLFDWERAQGAREMVTCSDTEVFVAPYTTYGKRKAYAFDRVYGPQCAQRQLFEEAILPSVKRAAEGYSCTVMAYGQTGTGKTYTLEGDFGNAEGAGVIPRVVHALWRELSSQGASFRVSVSHLEIYNEELADLLRPSELDAIAAVDSDLARQAAEAMATGTEQRQGGKTATGAAPPSQGQPSGGDADPDLTDPRVLSLPRTSSRALQAAAAKRGVRLLYIPQAAEKALQERAREIVRAEQQRLQMLKDPRGGVLVVGLEEVGVERAEDIFPVLERTIARRHTHETLMNKQSSRSHAIFHISVASKVKDGSGRGRTRVGHISLVDLSGSENLKRSGSSGPRAREAQHINQGLLALGRVIRAIVHRRDYVPYRDSKLTRLLEQSLGGDSLTTLILTVSPNSDDVEETVSTLSYASLAKGIRTFPHADDQSELEEDEHSNDSASDEDLDGDDYMHGRMAFDADDGDELVQFGIASQKPPATARRGAAPWGVSAVPVRSRPGSAPAIRHRKSAAGVVASASSLLRSRAAVAWSAHTSRHHGQSDGGLAPHVLPAAAASSVSGHAGHARARAYHAPSAEWSRETVLDVNGRLRPRACAVMVEIFANIAGAAAGSSAKPPPGTRARGKSNLESPVGKVDAAAGLRGAEPHILAPDIDQLSRQVGQPWVAGAEWEASRGTGGGGGKRPQTASRPASAAAARSIRPTSSRRAGAVPRTILDLARDAGVTLSLSGFLGFLQWQARTDPYRLSEFVRMHGFVRSLDREQRPGDRVNAPSRHRAGVTGQVARSGAHSRTDPSGRARTQRNSARTGRSVSDSDNILCPGDLDGIRASATLKRAALRVTRHRLRTPQHSLMGDGPDCVWWWTTVPERPGQPLLARLQAAGLAPVAMAPSTSRRGSRSHRSPREDAGRHSPTDLHRAVPRRPGGLSQRERSLSPGGSVGSDRAEREQLDAALRAAGPFASVGHRRFRGPRRTTTSARAASATEGGARIASAHHGSRSSLRSRSPDRSPTRQLPVSRIFGTRPSAPQRSPPQSRTSPPHGGRRSPGGAPSPQDEGPADGARLTDPRPRPAGSGVSAVRRARAGGEDTQRHSALASDFTGHALVASTPSMQQGRQRPPRGRTLFGSLAAQREADGGLLRTESGARIVNARPTRPFSAATARPPSLL